MPNLAIVVESAGRDSIGKNVNEVRREQILGRERPVRLIVRGHQLWLSIQGIVCLTSKFSQDHNQRGLKAAKGGKGKNRGKGQKKKKRGKASKQEDSTSVTVRYYCDPTGPTGSDVCKDGQWVSEEYREYCADCMYYTSHFCTYDGEQGKCVKNPSFCDGSDGQSPRCFPKRAEGEACHENWQCISSLDFPGLCRKGQTCI